MTRLGYTLMCEQSAPRDLVRDADRAEQAGFEFEVISDHYSPWLESQGHSPNAWATLGAIAQATSEVDLMTYVTCPTMRYHPAVVAQQAATVGLLSEGRFSLGVGAGENLNEHVVGRGWPSAQVRHEMLAEALHIIKGLFEGSYFDYSGSHFRVTGAKLFDIGDPPPEIGVAVSGPSSLSLANRYADFLIAVEPSPELAEGFTASPRRVGQVPISWDLSRDTAIDRAHDQFRWFGGGWKVNADLPGTAGFDAASQFVTKDDIADSIPCGPDLEAHLAAIQKFVDAGFTDVAVVQIGGETQPDFLDWAEKELVPAFTSR